MNIYLLTNPLAQKHHWQSAVVIASTRDQAQYLHPKVSEEYVVHWNTDMEAWIKLLGVGGITLYQNNGWCNPNEVSIQNLGVADCDHRLTEPTVILARRKPCGDCNI